MYRHKSLFKITPDFFSSPFLLLLQYPSLTRLFFFPLIKCTDRKTFFSVYKIELASEIWPDLPALNTWHHRSRWQPMIRLGSKCQSFSIVPFYAENSLQKISSRFRCTARLLFLCAIFYRRKILSLFYERVSKKKWFRTKIDPLPRPTHHWS